MDSNDAKFLMGVVGDTQGNYTFMERHNAALCLLFATANDNTLKRVCRPLKPHLKKDATAKS